MYTTTTKTQNLKHRNKNHTRHKHESHRHHCWMGSRLFSRGVQNKSYVKRGQMPTASLTHEKSVNPNDSSASKRPCWSQCHIKFDVSSSPLRNTSSFVAWVFPTRIRFLSNPMDVRSAEVGGHGSGHWRTTLSLGLLLLTHCLQTLWPSYPQGTCSRQNAQQPLHIVQPSQWHVWSLTSTCLRGIEAHGRRST